MNIREAIVDLLDRHTDTFAMSRRQLAELSGVNPGQLSNWLRSAGSLSSMKEGIVAQSMLELVEDALRREKLPQRINEIVVLAGVLRSYGPRRRLLAARPESALAGKPISRENPCYIKRVSDIDLEIRLRSELIQLSVVGGPKTGRSSLLYAAQKILEATHTVIYVDLADYRHEMELVDDDYEASHHFYRWLADRCEAQLGGSFRAVFNHKDDAVPWLLKNVLPNSPSGRCVLILDHPELLPVTKLVEYREHKSFASNPNAKLPEGSRELKALDRAMLEWLNLRAEESALHRFGVIMVADFAAKAFCHPDIHNSSVAENRLDRLEVSNLSEHEVGRLLQVQTTNLKSLHIAQNTAWRECGGHPYLTQRIAMAIETEKSIEEAISEGIQNISDVVTERWSENFRTEVCEEIDAILGNAGKENRNAGEESRNARKALLSTGLCVRPKPNEKGLSGRYPIRAVNIKYLKLFQLKIDPANELS